MGKKTTISIKVQSIPTEIIVPSVQYTQKRRCTFITWLLVVCIVLIGTSLGIYFGTQMRNNSKDSSTSTIADNMTNNTDSINFTNSNSSNTHSVNNTTLPRMINLSSLPFLTNATVSLNGTTNSPHHIKRRYLKFR
jgi:hypothetical protein